MKQHPTKATTALITCSYGPDFERCKRLCISVDRWVGPEFEHILIVPKRDRHLFSKLANNRRKVLSVEATVPGRFLQLPFSNKWWLGPLGWPTRGWVMQQITKLSAGFATEAENLIFVDSDIQFIRPFNEQLIMKEGKLRLHSIPGDKDYGIHLRWHKKAGELLGCDTSYAGADYVGQLITWKRSVLLSMLKRIEQHTSKSWTRAIAQSITVSEYILYGMYATRVLGAKEAGHYQQSQDLCHCCWDQAAATELESGRAIVEPHEIAVLIQSNLGYSDDKEIELMERACKLADTDSAA